ncbi:MAG: PmoA family protein, partial [Candidatus Latescibacteria bacterium]|nr:PmoA family protein [Candidatus Latescibacterota bacterium]
PDDRVEVRVAGGLFTAYHFGRHLVRPFCAPVNDAFGASVTRASIGEKAGETTDHIHHRSLWTAYGEVNGTDNWGEEGKHGRTVHRAFETLVSGPVFGRLRARSDWTAADGTVLLDETRDFTFYHPGAHPVRLFDLTVELQATHGDVHFGDTKEGGFLSIRVATSMDAVRGGKIENGYGAIGEAESWGRRAPWCDYSGPVDGRWSGIAVMEHPDTFRSPTYWHVRDYGLMATNPFGTGTFRNDPRQSGAYTLPAGERLVFAYRVYIHVGDATQGRVADVYHGYINPPNISVTSDK